MPGSTHLVTCTHPANYAVHSHPLNAEHIQVRNQTNSTLDLSDFAVGDEEHRMVERYAEFPAGSTLDAQGIAVLAMDKANFLTHFGVQADYEFRPADAKLRDMAV